MSLVHQAILEAASPVEDCSGSSVRQRRFRFAPDSIVFSGHFPEYPVLPAVVQILMARITLEEILGCGLRVCTVQAKFVAPVRPDEVVLLTVQPLEETLSYKCSLYCGERAAASFQLKTEQI